MAFSSSFCHSPLLALKVDHFRSNGGAEIELCNKLNVRSRVNLIRDRSFISGSRLDLKQKAMRLTHKKATPVYASLLSGSQLASSAFTIGTTAVLPFYTLMIFAPNSELTKRTMKSNVPYAILSILYAYLLYLSWTPETVELIFASKYLLPELTSIGKMFSSEMTLASAWIHLLVIDLFAARYFKMDKRIRLRLGIQFLFACSFALLGFFLIS